MSRCVGIHKVSKETLESLFAALHDANEQMRGEMTVSFACASSVTFEKCALLESLVFNEIARRAQL